MRGLSKRVLRRRHGKLKRLKQRVASWYQSMHDKQLIEPDRFLYAGTTIDGQRYDDMDVLNAHSDYKTGLYLPGARRKQVEVNGNGSYEYLH